MKRHTAKHALKEIHNAMNAIIQVNAKNIRNALKDNLEG